MKAHYLNRDWRYNTAASHANADAFRRRQHQRRRAAQEAAKAVVRQIKRRAA